MLRGSYASAKNKLPGITSNRVRAEPAFAPRAPRKTQHAKPELLEGLSPGLKSRMQGKSCFNFFEVDKPLFKELAALTEAGFASYKEQGFV